jgi:hypothetical protein
MNRKTNRSNFSNIVFAWWVDVLSIKIQEEVTPLACKSELSAWSMFYRMDIYRHEDSPNMKNKMCGLLWNIEVIYNVQNRISKYKNTK